MKGFFVEIRKSLGSLLLLALLVAGCAETYGGQGNEDSPYPLEITDMPFTGGTIEPAEHNEVSSYYVINGLVPNQAYTLSLSNINVSGVLAAGAYSDLPMDILSMFCTEECVFIPGKDHVYIRVSSVSGEEKDKTGGTFTLNLFPTTSFGNQGTIVSPVTISASSTPQTASVGATTSHFTLTGLNPGQIYKIFTSLESTPLSIASHLSQGCVREANAENTCIFGASTTETSFSVTNSAYTPAGTDFLIEVAPSAINVDFGDTFDPFIVPLASLPLASTATDSGFSSYKITGLTPGTPYNLFISGLSGTAEASLSSYSVDGECTIPESSTKIICQFVPTNDYVKFCIEGVATGGVSFTIEIIPAFSNEGSTTTPVAIPLLSMPYSGMTGSGSYYEITGLSGLTGYHLYLSGLIANADLYVWNDSTFFTPAGSSFLSGVNTESLNLTTLPAQTNLFVSIRGDQTIAGTNFSFNVKPLPANVGSAAMPVAIAYSGTPVTYSAQVAHPVGSLSYFEVTGLTPGTPYLISLTDMTSDVDLTVFGSDPTFTTTACASSQPGTSDDSCVCSPVSTSLYIRVDRFAPQGGYFNLNIR